MARALDGTRKSSWFCAIPMSTLRERGSIAVRMERAYWEMIADDISRDGWCWGMSEAIIEGKRMFVVDAHRGDRLPRHIVSADTLLGAFLELKNELRDPLCKQQAGHG